MKHSVIVFFVWHGLESCWRLAVVEPDESIVFYGLESCWRSVVSELFSCFFMGSKGDVKHFVCVFLLGMGSNLAGVSVFSNLTLTRADETLSSHRSESTFRTVFCFAWQRLDCCWRSGVSEPKLCFFSYLLFLIIFLYIFIFSYGFQR